jgi:hypothetical protein
VRQLGWDFRASQTPRRMPTYSPRSPEHRAGHVRIGGGRGVWGWGVRRRRFWHALGVVSPSLLPPLSPSQTTLTLHCCPHLSFLPEQRAVDVPPGGAGALAASVPGTHREGVWGKVVGGRFPFIMAGATRRKRGLGKENGGKGGSPVGRKGGPKKKAGAGKRRARHNGVIVTVKSCLTLFIPLEALLQTPIVPPFTPFRGGQRAQRRVRGGWKGAAYEGPRGVGPPYQRDRAWWPLGASV